MGKLSNIDEITTILAGALRHKIGALVGREEYYEEKYKLEANARFEKAKKIVDNCHFNTYDKSIIKSKLLYKLKNELESREYIDNKKFEIMDKQIDEVLKELELD